jgi:hypothetical protein
VDNIRMDLGEVGWGDVDWIGLAQDRDRWRALVNSVLNLRVSQNAGKLSSGLTSSGPSSSAQLHSINTSQVATDVLITCHFDQEYHQTGSQGREDSGDLYFMINKLRN